MRRGSTSNTTASAVTPPNRLRFLKDPPYSGHSTQETWNESQHDDVRVYVSAAAQLRRYTALLAHRSGKPMSVFDPLMTLRCGRR
jgi:hypothetical protein